MFLMKVLFSLVRSLQRYVTVWQRYLIIFSNSSGFNLKVPETGNGPIQIHNTTSPVHKFRMSRVNKYRLYNEAVHTSVRCRLVQYDETELEGRTHCLYKVGRILSSCVLRCFFCLVM